MERWKHTEGRTEMDGWWEFIQHRGQLLSQAQCSDAAICWPKMTPRGRTETKGDRTGQISRVINKNIIVMKNGAVMECFVGTSAETVGKVFEESCCLRVKGESQEPWTNDPLLLQAQQRKNSILFTYHCKGDELKQSQTCLWWQEPLQMCPLVVVHLVVQENKAQPHRRWASRIRNVRVATFKWEYELIFSQYICLCACFTIVLVCRTSRQRRLFDYSSWCSKDE